MNTITQPYQRSKRQKQEEVKNLPVFKLCHLPLRPSTLSILTQRGFNSTADVQSSKGVNGGGISNFASELEVPLVDAVKISQEVERAMQSVTVPTTRNDENDSRARNGSGNTNTNTNGQLSSSSSSSSSLIHHEKYNRIPRRAPQTAAQILSSHYNQPSLSRPIISFVRSIDSLLGGGFHPKEVIEVAGLPGVG